jgi:hypothetical protein
MADALPGCVELDSDGGAPAFPHMQERGGSGSRAGVRLVLVHLESLDGTEPSL